MKKYLITNIWWDVDDEDFDAYPQRIVVKVDEEDAGDDLEEYLSDLITGEYDVCHKGFDYEEVEADDDEADDDDDDEADGGDYCEETDCGCF